MLHARPTWWSLAADGSIPLLLFTSMIVAGLLSRRSDSHDLIEVLGAWAGLLLGIFLNFQISANYLTHFLREHKSDEIVV